MTRFRFPAVVLTLALTAACTDAARSPVSPSQPLLAKGTASSNPHYIASATGAQLDPSPTLAVYFKIAGVGSGVTINVTATAEAHRTDACVNGGENVPSDRKKRSSIQTVSLTLPVTATAGGNVEETFFLPFPASTLNCPSGQVATLFSGFWDNAASSTPSPSGGPVISFDIAGTFNVQ
jgi:hypothetical protein